MTGSLESVRGDSRDNALSRSNDQQTTALSRFNFRVAGVERSESPDVLTGGSRCSTPATQP